MDPCRPVEINEISGYLDSGKTVPIAVPIIVGRRYFGLVCFSAYSVMPTSSRLFAPIHSADLCPLGAVCIIDHGPLRPLPACMGMIFETAAGLRRSAPPHVKYDLGKMDPCRPVGV